MFYLKELNINNNKITGYNKTVLNNSITVNKIAYDLKTEMLQAPTGTTSD